MKTRNLIIALLLTALTVFLYPVLPDHIPMHWNIRGEIDSYMPKNPAVFIIPLMTFLMLFLFKIIPSFDPKKDKYSLFKNEWEIIQTGLISFFSYLQFIILYISLKPEVKIMPLMFIGLGSLFILLGNFMSKIRQNFFIGIRIPWTLSDEDNWNKTHRFAGWCFVIAGITTLGQSFYIWQAPVIIFGSILIAVLLPVIYSFLLFKKSLYLMKYIYMGLAVVILSIFLIKLFSSEDDWICREGKWIKHGYPNTSMPQTECRQ